MRRIQTFGTEVIRFDYPRRDILLVRALVFCDDVGRAVSIVIPLVVHKLALTLMGLRSVIFRISGIKTTFFADFAWFVIYRGLT